MNKIPEWKELDVDKIARAFYLESMEKMMKLRKHCEERKDKEDVKLAPLYIDIIHKIDELIG